MHPLDNPIWSALSTRHARFASNGALARRIRADIGPFAAAIDNTDDAVAALAALTQADDDMSLLQRAPPAPPPGIALKLNAAGVQMIATHFPAGAEARLPVIPLGDADAPEMIALAQLTKPGPFRTATHTLGRFIGIRDNGVLVAMAGERMQTDDFVEVSAVCTHPDHRGHGYGAALTRIVADRIRAEDRTPFLHAYANNTGAIALYRRLGFEHRCDVTLAAWSRA